MNKIYNIFFFLLLLGLYFLKPGFKSSLDSGQLMLFSSIFLGAVSLHFYKYSKIYKNWFRLDVFFLLGFGIVHFQWPIMYSISGVSPEFITRVWVDEMYVNYGTWLSTIGVVAWVFGFSILKTAKWEKDIIWVFNYKKLLNLTIGLFILFIITAGEDFLTGGVYKGTGGSAAGSGISVYIRLIFSTAIILLTVTIIIANKHSYNSNIIRWFFSLDKKFLALFFSYIILFLLIGDRGGPVSLLLSALIIIGTMVRPIKFFELSASVILGAILLTLISLGRSESSGFGILSAGAEKFEYSSGYDTTLELANSVRTLYKSLTEVPENQQYFYGSLWMGDLLAPLPFSQSLYLNLTGIPDYKIGSAGYITYLTFGKNPTSGEGTTLIADVYLNFALFGVVIFMFLLGFFFKKTSNELVLQNNFKWLIVGGILASFSLYFSRSGLFVMLRPIIWGIILALFLVKKYKYSE